MKHLHGWLSIVSLTLLTLALAGCGGGGGGAAAAPTKTTATGTLSATGGTSGATALSVAAPAGVTLSISANTAFTDTAGNPVSGSIDTSVGYSTTTSDLPAAAQTLPAGATLVAFADVSFAGATAQVKNFSKPVSLGFKVPAGAAATGAALALYSFDSSTGQWSFARTETVDSSGNITPGVSHLSIWGVFKSSTTPPVKPATFSAGAGDGQATLTWATASDAAYYNIYYSTTPGVTAANGTRIDHATSGGQIVTGLTNGTNYYFVVTALNPGGESIISAERGPITPATLPLPGNTAGVAVTSPAPGQASVTWNTAVTNAATFNVYFLKATAQPTQAQVLAGSKQSSTTSPLLLTGLSSGSTYYVLVAAANASGAIGGTQTTPKPVLVQ
jgi:hypothetical protein